MRSFAMTTICTAAGALFAAVPALAQDDRIARGEAIVRTLNGGQAQPTLEGLRRDFPFLADAIAGYALGDVWARPGLDHRTRQIAAVAAFAARPFPPAFRAPSKPRKPWVNSSKSGARRWHRNPMSACG